MKTYYVGNLVELNHSRCVVNGLLTRLSLGGGCGNSKKTIGIDGENYPIGDFEENLEMVQSEHDFGIRVYNH